MVDQSARPSLLFSSKGGQAVLGNTKMNKYNLSTKPKHMKYIIVSIVLLLSCPSINAQPTIKPAKGYDTQVGNMVSMLEDLKGRITRTAKRLDQKGTDFLMDDQSNSIGAMILHLAATEKHYQVYTFEGRGYNAEEAAFWDTPMNLGDAGRKELGGKPMSYYLDKWDEVRAETLRLLKTKDDEWLNSKSMGGGMNNHWAWFHVMEHQANHMGQINMIVKRVK